MSENTFNGDNVVCGKCGVEAPIAGVQPRCDVCGEPRVFVATITPRGRRLLAYLDSIGWKEGDGAPDVPDHVLDDPIAP